jgi:2'-5' RNA ligase
VSEDLESVVLVPALGVGPLVRDLRMRYDPSAAAGVPPHITLMFPFLPPAALTDRTIGTLARVIGGTGTFHFSLTRVNQFEQGVVYLEPEPSGPFVELTRKISREFGILPFGGEFGDEPVAHLTVAIEPSSDTRQQLVDHLQPVLPIVIMAKEAWLMVGSNARAWKTVRRMPFSH